MVLNNFIIEHHLLILLTVGAVFTWGWLYYFRKAVKINGITALILAGLCSLLGVGLVRAFAFLEGNTNKGAMSLFGAVFFMPLFFLLGAKLFKRSPRLVCDIFTPCLVFTVLLARINCLINGCCIGTVISSNSGKVFRWPVRELEILFYIAILVFFIPQDIYFYREGSKRTISGGFMSKWFDAFIPGSLYPLYMLSYGVLRFILEFVRDINVGSIFKKPNPSIFHLAHLWAFLAIGTGVIFLFELKEENKRKKKKKK